MLNLDTHFNLRNRVCSVREFFNKKMGVSVISCCLFIRTCLFYTIGFIARYFFRFQEEDSTEKIDTDVLVQEEDHTIGPESKPEAIDCAESEYDGGSEKESPNFRFKFRFEPSVDTNNNDNEKTPTSIVHKYSFLSERDFVGFMEEPKIMSLNVEESYISSNYNNKESSGGDFRDGLVLENEIGQGSSEKDGVHEVIESKISESAVIGDDQFNSDVNLLELLDLGDESPVMNQTVVLKSDGFLSENDFGVDEQNSNEEGIEAVEEEGTKKTEETHLENLWNWDTESIYLSNNWTRIFKQTENSKLELSDSVSVDFSDDSFSAGTRIPNSKLYDESMSDTDSDDSVGEEAESTVYIQEHEQTHLQNSTISDTESESSNGSCSVELTNLANPIVPEKESIGVSDAFILVNNPTPEKESIGVSDAFISVNNPTNDSKECSEAGGQNIASVVDTQNSERKSVNLNPEDSSGLESQWEHQDLIEQLRMELKKVRATGLPTILEESESPKIVEDFKPWKIDEKFMHEDPMDELQRFYKSYRERMRKFDILNYQKMYAIGFLQLKDPLQSMSNQKTSIPAIISQNLLRLKRGKNNRDPSKKFIKELQSDLEVVYVGQACLSWEFLYWQYEKARELLDSDPYGCRHYNQVAGEFQQFQVLMQRFLENEPFQGPRVQNYVKTRCVLRNLLQVPPIKEDSSKDKREERRKDAITNDLLILIIEESMKVFWEFMRADKDEVNTIMKGILGTQVELQDPSDSELFAEIQMNLQKKEKKLKDLLKSGNCVVRRFQKNPEAGSTDLILFLSRVDMKLVSRVLRMSRLTSEQLSWCHKKLDNISVTYRKVYREPAFLLFPC